jgi:hypothetical protein
MTRPLARLRVPAVALLAVLVLSACDEAESPAAEVNGSVISTEQLAADVEMFDFLTAISGSTCGTPIEGETQDSACARLTLTNLIQEDLVKQYAAEHDVVTDPEAVTNAIAQIEGSLGGAAELDAQLADEGLTRAGLLAIADRLLLFNSVQDAVAAETLTDEAIQQLYEENRSQFTSVEVSHILVPTQEEAEEIAAEATPKNFADLAAERSTDTVSAENGGSLGAVAESAFASQFDPTFVQAALELQPGQISEPVQTQFGWHVIELVARDVIPLEQVRDQIVASASGESFTTWITEQMSSADITVNPRYGVFDPATGQVEPVRSTDTDGPVSPVEGVSGATGP